MIDGLRPRTAVTVAEAELEDQRRFLREDLRQWDVLRHRMPPTVADAIEPRSTAANWSSRPEGRRCLAARERRGTRCDSQ